MKKPWLAGVLSFIFSGLGQLYVGKIGIGIALLLGYLALIIIGGLQDTFGAVISLFALLGALILWVVNIVHAAKKAKAVNTHAAS
ncbi:hypothetical protein [Halobacillus campisalis]|uniref:TM2 domain-containing protein n=1 Tax=Halobacillus campisalis TaxID=435909 RepID=A0ABW2K0X1_9BACI|nr:hypothetical protein [Halobacillus campisalis]